VRELNSSVLVSFSEEIMACNQLWRGAKIVINSSCCNKFNVALKCHIKMKTFLLENFFRKIISLKKILTCYEFHAYIYILCVCVCVYVCYVCMYINCNVLLLLYKLLNFLFSIIRVNFHITFLYKCAVMKCRLLSFAVANSVG